MRRADLTNPIRAAPPAPPFEPRLARIAAAIADPSRSRMLACLLGGRYASAGELARVAAIASSTASGHLATLLDAGLLSVEQRGRHRYYKLADAEVAHALEALALVAERGASEHQWNSAARRPLRDARCCYGHLAGRLGVGLLDALERGSCLAREADDGGDWQLTAAGSAWLRAIGVEPPQPVTGRRFAYPCLDWSERRDHLAGQLATTLLDHFISRRWLVHDPARAAPAGPRAGRVLTLTAAGRRELLPLIDG